MCESNDTSLCPIYSTNGFRFVTTNFINDSPLYLNSTTYAPSPTNDISWVALHVLYNRENDGLPISLPFGIDFPSLEFLSIRDWHPRIAVVSSGSYTPHVMCAVLRDDTQTSYCFVGVIPHEVADAIDDVQITIPFGNHIAFNRWQEVAFIDLGTLPELPLGSNNLDYKVGFLFSDYLYGSYSFDQTYINLTNCGYSGCDYSYSYALTMVARDNIIINV